MQYAKMYTDENVRRGMAPPPPPPLNDSYTMYGNVFTNEDCIVSSLESQGIRRLYSAKDVDRKRELRKLNHSVLVNFLDLLDLLIKAPDSSKREEKIEDLNLLFIHMHHLINEFRPHQARETLRVLLHVQKRKRLQLADKFKEHLDKVQETIEEALNALPDQGENGDSKLMVPTETSDSVNQNGHDQEGGNSSSSTTSVTEENPTKTASSLDRIMCQIVDDMDFES